MVDLGIIREGSPVYLWDGEIIELMVEDNPHFNAVDHLRDLLKAARPAAEWSIRHNMAVQLAPGYRPQPDISVIRGPQSNYRKRKKRPRPADVALVIEVSDTTYDYDSGEFLRKYAEVGITPYWIINLHARRIEVYTDPDAEAQAYRSRKDYGLDESVPLRLTVDGNPLDFGVVSVRDVLQDSLELDDPGNGAG